MAGQSGGPGALPGEEPASYSPGNRFKRVWGGGLTPILVGLSVIPLLLLLLQFGPGRDQGIYAVVARVMAAGGMPYRDAWDFKPPGIFFLYGLARWLGGPGMLAVRALEAVALGSQVVAFGLLTRRFLGVAAPGLWGGALATLIHVQLEFWHTGQPESFGGPVLAWALVLVSAADGRWSIPRLVSAGCLFGFAGLLKPPLAGGAVLVALILARDRSRRSGEGWVRALAVPAAAISAGAFLVLGGTVAWFAARGALPDLLETFLEFVPRYTALGLSDAGLVSLTYRAVTETLFGYAAVIAAGVMLLLLAGEPSPEARRLLWLVGAVCSPQLVGIALQAKFFPYHYGAVLPFGALVASLGWARAFDRATGRMVRLVGVASIVLLLDARSAQRDLPDSFMVRCGLRLKAALSGKDGTKLLDRLHTVADVDGSENRAAADWLAKSVPIGAPVFVWGFEPIIYEMSDRPPASRYIYDVPARAPWFASTSRPRLMGDLRRARPLAILVERGDVSPQVTGDLQDSERALSSFPELRALLDESYERRAETGRFVFLTRRPGG